jgi:hypothetical protein
MPVSRVLQLTNAQVLLLECVRNAFSVIWFVFVGYSSLKIRHIRWVKRRLDSTHSISDRPDPTRANRA